MTIAEAPPRACEAPGTSLAVSTTGLTKRFGERTVVDDVGLAIPRGSVSGFVGRTGRSPSGPRASSGPSSH